MADSMSGASGASCPRLDLGPRSVGATVRAVASAEVPDRLGGVRRVLAWVLIGQVAVLAATGLFLALAYRATPTQAWGVLVAEEGGIGGPSFAHSVRSWHRWTAWSTVLPGLVLAAVAFGEAMARWRGPRRRRSGALTGPAVAVLVLVGLVTGFALPYDQLALRAVTVGTSIRGYDWLLGDDVRFVLVDGFEVSVATMRAIFAAHVLVISPALALVLAVTVRRRRTRPAGSEPTDHEWQRSS